MYSQVRAPALLPLKIISFQSAVLKAWITCKEYLLNWYSTAPTNASPAPVVSIGFTDNAGNGNFVFLMHKQAFLLYPA